ncbi:MAG: hypothetical protein ACYC0C_09665 [Devosia sp.]
MRQHPQRLKNCTEASIGASNIHLVTIRALKTINAPQSAIGYLTLAGTGEVLDSRLTPADYRGRESISMARPSRADQ